MKRAIPVIGILLFIVMVITSCAPPRIRPGFGSYKGYHYKKHYKTLKPSYTSPQRMKYKKYR